LGKWNALECHYGASGEVNDSCVYESTTGVGSICGFGAEGTVATVTRSPIALRATIAQRIASKISMRCYLRMKKILQQRYPTIIPMKNAPGSNGMIRSPLAKTR